MPRGTIDHNEGGAEPLDTDSPDIGSPDDPVADARSLLAGFFGGKDKAAAVIALVQDAVSRRPPPAVAALVVQLQQERNEARQRLQLEQARTRRAREGRETFRRQAEALAEVLRDVTHEFEHDPRTASPVCLRCPEDPLAAVHQTPAVVRAQMTTAKPEPETVAPWRPSAGTYWEDCRGYVWEAYPDPDHGESVLCGADRDDSSVEGAHSPGELLDILGPMTRVETPEAASGAVCDA